MSKIQPTFQERKGLVSASLFEREVEGSQGSFISSSVALNISYRKDNEFKQNSLSITKNNLSNVIDVLKKVKLHLK